MIACFSHLRGDCQDGGIRYDKEASTSYSVTNDSEGICIRVMTLEPSQQRKILRNGLELWLDPRGKKNKSIGILFPLPSKGRSNVQQGGGSQRSSDGPPPFSPGSANDTGQQDEKKMLRSLVEGQKEMKILNIPNSSGLRVSLHFAGDTLIYEVQIPLTVFPASFSFEKPLGIGIIEKGAPLPDFGANEMPGGDGGPPGGGMMPAGPPPGNFSDDEGMQKLFADDSIWFRFKPVLK